eukprot:TRINITY_DN74895_c0_g1_i1.p1 TRINITY_DN74895_c0_g1~~TRINITY_DN74895_c0_g1_i1.p1  ORF type:complete len:132 (+),score=4.11 TRINITY_DN74895_c0_g1_i1:22-396(+)
MWAGVPSEPLCLHTQGLATAQSLAICNQNLKNVATLTIKTANWKIHFCNIKGNIVQNFSTNYSAYKISNILTESQKNNTHTKTNSFGTQINTKTITSATRLTTYFYKQKQQQFNHQFIKCQDVI